MKFDAQDCILVSKKNLTPAIFDFRLKNPELAEMCHAGQFVHVLVPGKTLRRPISVCDVEGDVIRLVFEIRGDGTRIMSETKEGETVNIIAPLGNGFDLSDGRKTAFIGGRIGVPPMLFSARTAGADSIVINGFRDKSAVILTEDFKKLGVRLIETTDNGSYGIHGFVTGPLSEIIDEVDRVCACGPTPMLKRIAEICREHGKECLVSLEQRMACGVGACLGCAVAVIREDGTNTYKHVCKDGPVFRSEEVVW